jgi:uracil-DNA glycosylase
MIQTWADFLSKEKKLPYFLEIETFLQRAHGEKKIYPPQDKMFRAFELCSLSSLKVVIIGQDPYHQPGQANGLAFSVNQGVKLPPSLKNIFKEIESDLEIKMNGHDGDLSYLATQGVLMINSLLSVEEGKPLSHRHLGYDLFFQHLLNFISSLSQPIVFLLWGHQAKQYLSLIDYPHHHLLFAHHPSPLSANRGGWFGCRHFSKTNQWLTLQGRTPIQWSNTFNKICYIELNGS